GCTGLSFAAPLVEIAVRDGGLYHYDRVSVHNVRDILVRHFPLSGRARKFRQRLDRLLANLVTGDIWEPVTRYPIDLRDGPESLYRGRQEHLVTEHCGSLDPLDLEGYISHGGISALKGCLHDQSSAEIIRLIERSGLRGRGGGGYPTGRKWASVRAAAGKQKYIICNGDEGDPGAFMDRMILESFPFKVIEGMIIAAFAVGASKGCLYIRSEYPLAIGRINRALEICRARGFLGDRILGSDFNLDLVVFEGAGAFVSGEETALIAALEGKRGTPRFRPPYPSEAGLWNDPTLVNNVETLALVPWIIRHGPEAFAARGTPGSTGTKTFALAGKVIRGGLIEVPMGITLREIVDDIGGGVQAGRRLKAVQVGGPSGGCVPATLADTPVDFEQLAAAGAIVGSGGLVVLDETDCMVDIARYFMAFTQVESCGKCTPCRVGTRRMLERLERLCQGRGRDGDIEELERLAETVKKGSLCGLGRTAPNPVLSTIQHFRDEYEAHIQGRCPARVCRDLITYRITDDCIGCTRCAQHCPAQAIPSAPYRKHEINQEKCVKCGTCRQVCPSDAVTVE
ncbi:MAG: NADH-ubiquinone oxidoreductase-F iron-sulfur binding region domain-containing protein, partial [Gemmatimonadota bacterium]|nr:NADH-ubiquinone oxidoreductase-F iron-sulfur binding region domain-containing protein [Gemmatimonadota bacterium]